MRLFEFTKLNSCYEVNGFITNTINFLRKSIPTSTDINDIKSTIYDDENSQQLLACLYRNPSLRPLFLEIKTYLK